MTFSGKERKKKTSVVRNLSWSGQQSSTQFKEKIKLIRTSGKQMRLQNKRG